MDIESILSNTLFFPSIKNGIFDYSTPMKSSLTKFDIDKSTEPSQSLFEYFFYKMIKRKLKEGQINSETVLITEKFLTTFNCKKIFIKSKAIHKKNILIFLQHKFTLKWNLIVFLNLEEQLKNCFNENNKQPIVAKIISSNLNADEDDYILNSTMDKLENTFDFKSPDDIQFEVDSINISDQPNTFIFLLNFIEGLIVQSDENISLYISKLYEEGSNTFDVNSKNYFTSFNRIGEDLENVYIKYQNELNEYIKKNKNSILNFDAEKILNGNNEILKIENSKVKNDKNSLNEENGSPEGGQLANGLEKIDLGENKKASKEFKIKDEYDMIKIEQDDDLDDELNSEEEEEALKIMERENQEAKSQMRDQERKLRQRLYKQKLRLKNINMYKEFGVIKEEDNESESESIDLFNMMKEEKEKNMNENFKKSLRKAIEEKRKSKINKSINSKSNSENKDNIILNTENNIIINNKNKEIEKEIFNNENNELDMEQRSKSEKSIKLSVLQDLEEAIEEFESEQDPNKNKEKNNINANTINTNNKKKADIKNTENVILEKKNTIKSENVLDDDNGKKEKDKKYINIFKENLDIKKRNSMPKSKETEINSEEKNNKNEKLKKSYTSTKKVENKKKAEAKKENLLVKNIKKDNYIANNYKSNKSSKSNSSVNSNKIKEDNNSSSNSNNTTKVYNANSFNSNSSKSNNDQDKLSSKDKNKENNSNKKEPKDNLIKKNIINNSKNENSSKNKNNQNIKKANSKTIREKQSKPILQSKISINSQKSNSTNKSNETNSKSNEKSSTKSKKKNLKEIEIRIEKDKITDFSAIDNPLNVLPPQKIVERNGYYDLKDKDKIENGSNLSLKLTQNCNDINSVKSDKINDYSSNINIENIYDDFESEKGKNEGSEIKEEGSLLGESRIKKTTMVRKMDKKVRAKMPPGKSKTIPFNDYCNYDEEGTNKICGCIGEQSNGICPIF